MSPRRSSYMWALRWLHCDGSAIRAELGRTARYPIWQPAPSCGDLNHVLDDADTVLDVSLAHVAHRRVAQGGR